MKALITGTIGFDTFFGMEQLVSCMESISVDKNDHCGKRTAIAGTTIQSILIAGQHAPSQIYQWAQDREITIHRYQNKQTMFESIVEPMGSIDAGDCIIAFCEDQDSDEARLLSRMAKKARRKLYMFSKTREKGWSLIKKEKPAATGMLF